MIRILLSLFLNGILVFGTRIARFAGFLFSKKAKENIHKEYEEALAAIEAQTAAMPAIAQETVGIDTPIYASVRPEYPTPIAAPIELPQKNTQALRPAKQRFSFFSFIKKNQYEFVAAFVLFGMVGAFFATHATTQRTSMPIPYQGRLLDSSYAPKADGTYYFRFAIYNSASGAGCLWATGGCSSELPAQSVTATVSRGLFTALLGNGDGNDDGDTSDSPIDSYDPEIDSSITGNFNSGKYYLGVTVCGTDNSCNTEMTPRKQLSGTLFAYNSDYLDGIDSTGFLILSPTTTPQTLAFTGIATDGLTITGNSLTAGRALVILSSSLTSGKLLDLQVSGTAAGASQTALNIGTAGANATSSITTYGAQISNTHTGTTSTNIAGYFVATGATTSYGLQVAALTSATSTGLDIGALSGATANTGIAIGAISGASTGAGITIGNFTNTGATQYGMNIGAFSGTHGSGDGTTSGLIIGNISSNGTTSTNTGITLGTLTGGTTANYQISTGILTSATTTTNAQLNLGGVVTTGGTSNYGVNIGALSGTGTTNYAVNIATLTSTGTVSGGINIGGLSGAATTGYGINIGNLSGATTSKGIVIGALSSATSTGLDIGALSGATANRGISIGAITAAATANNFGLDIGAITPQTGATVASINTAGIAATAGTATYGLNLGTNASTATTNYGIKIGAISGAGTTNYGLYIDTVSGGTGNNYALYTAGAVNTGALTATTGTFSGTNVNTVKLTHDYTLNNYSELAFGSPEAGSGAFVRSYRYNENNSGNEGNLVFGVNYGTATSTDPATGVLQLYPASLGPVTSGGLTLGTASLPWGASYMGALTATTGTFSSTLSATKGTFTGLETTGSPPLGFAASKWMVQTEDATNSRMYWMGPDASTYGVFTMYRAKSTGTPIAELTFPAAGGIQVNALTATTGTFSGSLTIQTAPSYDSVNANTFALGNSNWASVDNNKTHGWYWNTTGSAANGIALNLVRQYNNAASGTSTSTALTVDNGGNVGIGTTSAYDSAKDVLTVTRAQAALTRIVVDNQTNNAAGAAGIELSAYGGAWNIYAKQSAGFVNDLIFSGPGNVGINQTVPGGIFHVSQDADSDVIFEESSTDATAALTLNLRKSRGTNASKSIVVSGDLTGQIVFRGAQDSTTFASTAVIKSFSDGTPGATNDMPGRLSFWTTADGSSTPTERMRIDSAGNVIVGTAALGTTATDGFLYIPSSAGTPTGTPTSYTGRVPMVYDSTNDKFCIYDGAWLCTGAMVTQ